MPSLALQQDDGLSLTACLLCLGIRTGVGQTQDVRSLAPAIVPAGAAGLAVQCRLQLPDRRLRWLPQGPQRDEGDPVATIALGLQVETTINRLADRRLGLGIPRRGHGGAAGPHDRIPS